MLRILVIGATGRFSGIVDQLLARGHTVEAEPQKFSARNSHTMSSSFPVLLFRDPGMRIFRWCDGYLDLFRSSTLTMSATPAACERDAQENLAGHVCGGVGDGQDVDEVEQHEADEQSHDYDEQGSDERPNSDPLPPPPTR